jgi:hypothetical protein
MTILIIALTMAGAMMVAAYRSIEIERQAAMYRTLKQAGRGRFPEQGDR